jgi:lysophospholipase L1-like esterase
MAITIKKSDAGGSFTVTDEKGFFNRCTAGDYRLTKSPNGKCFLVDKHKKIDANIINDKLPTEIINGDTGLFFTSFEDLDLYISTGTSFFRKAGGVTGAPGNVFLGLGNSLVLGDGIFGTGLYSRGRSDPLNWAHILTDGRIVYGGNLGVGGNTSAQILARVPSAIALKPDWVILETGTNDALQGIAYATFKANVIATVTLLKAAGIKVALTTIVPSTDAVAKQYIPRFNAFLTYYAYANDLPLIDWYNKLANPAGTGGALPAYSVDGTHVNAAGGRVIGQAIVDSLANLIGNWKPYLAITQTNSNNIFSNGLNVDTNSDGLADTWVKAGTGVATIVTDTAIVGNWQKLAVTDGTVSKLSLLTTTGFIVGDRMAFSCRMKSDTVSPSKVNLYIEFAGPFTSYYFLRDFDVVLESHISYMEFDVPAGTTGMRINIASSAGGTNASIQIAQQTLINLTQLAVL